MTKETELLTGLIRRQIEKYLGEGKRMFATSSFQTHSLPMLHILSRIEKSIPVYFINTGFHFPETVSFRDHVSAEFGLNLVDLQPLVSKSQQRDKGGNLFFTSDPDYCCFLNKVQPLEPVLARYDVWINGVRADQNANRKNMQAEQKTPQGTLRYHPMLQWTDRMIFEYIREHHLPRHPLEEKGYMSIGCEPCTRKADLENSRDGRWFGLNKTECGLHTELINPTPPES